MFGRDYDSERAASVDDYKLTCIRFIEDISRDYKDWVDRYRLPEQESMGRKGSIDSVARTTSEWIAKFGDTIKKIDIIKDDGINKMAELTAGYTFEFTVTVGDQSRYVHHERGQIGLQVKGRAREDRGVRICPYSRDQFVQILSSAPASVDRSKVNLEAGEVLDEVVILDTLACKPSDVVSITICMEEVSGGVSVERRGLTTLLRLR